MFNSPTKILSSFLALTLSVSLLSACGQNDKGDRGNTASSNSSSSSSQSSDPFASRTAARKKDQFLLTLTLSEVQALITAGTLPQDDVIREHSVFTYDALNRIESEIITVFPQADPSILPPEGAVALQIDFTYRNDVTWQSDVTMMQIWNNWSDNSTGYRTQTTIWTDRVYDEELLMESSEEVISYEQSPDNIILGTRTADSTNTFNNLKYQIGSTSVTADQETSRATMIRSTNGMWLDQHVTNDYTTDYEYNNEGRLEGYEKVYSQSGLREVHDFYYATFENNYLILIDTERFDSTGGLINSELRLQIYEQAICNKNSILRTTRLVPEYWECRELAHWDDL